MGYRTKIFAILILVLCQTNFVLAACSAQGETVVYVNGVFSSYAKANSDLLALKEEFYTRTNDHSVLFKNGYNESHFAGAGDLLKSWVQAHTATTTYVDDYDLDTILLNLHDQLTTRRVLFVGHSQGGYYTNALYDYLVNHGEPREALGVYNIATLDTHVASGGKYLNSSGDTLLTFVKTIGFNPPQTNIDLVSEPDDALKGWPGHALTSAYLAGASDRIVSEMASELADLKPALATDKGECFTPPSNGLVYQSKQAFFVIVDPLAIGIRDGSVATYNGLAAVGSTLGNFAATIGSVLVNDTLTVVGGANGLSHANEPRFMPTNFDIVGKLYGSSLTGEDVKDYLGGSLGSAVLLAIQNKETLKVQPTSQEEEKRSQPAEPMVPQQSLFKTEPGFGGGGGGVAVLGASTEEPASTESAAEIESTPESSADTTDTADTLTPPVEDPEPTTPEEMSVPPVELTPSAPAITMADVDTLWPLTGFYCEGNTTILTSTTQAPYRPASRSCTYLAGFSENPSWTVRYEIYRGTVGNSKLENVVQNNNPANKQVNDPFYDISDAASGTQFFVAMYEYYGSVGGSYNAFYIPEMESYLQTGADTHGNTDMPPLSIRILPFVIP